MPVTLPTGLTDEHRAELERLSRRWVYMPTTAYSDYRGYTFFLGGLAAVVAAIFNPADYHGDAFWGAALGCLSLGFLIIFLTCRSRRLAFRNAVAQLGQSPGFVTLNKAGVQMHTNTAAGALQPWPMYQSATLGENVLLLFRAPRSKRFNVISLSAMSAEERIALIAELRQHLGASNLRVVSR